MTLLLGAMEGEIEQVRRGLGRCTVDSWNGFDFFRGSLQGRQVVVARTGVGKSLSAMLCQHLIEVYSPERILFTGIAGALNPELSIGDTLIARDSLIHDMDATALGFERGEIPYSPHRIIQCDVRLVELASAIEPLQGARFVGRILTGDQFVASPATRDSLRDELGGDAVEMEGASVGLVATVNGIPFLLLRTISDKADGTVGLDLRAFLEFASRNAWHYLRQIVLSSATR